MKIFLLFTFIFLTGCQTLRTNTGITTDTRSKMVSDTSSDIKVFKQRELLEKISIATKHNGFSNLFTLDKGALMYVGYDAYGAYFLSAKKVRQVVPAVSVDKEVLGGLYIPFDPSKNHSLFIGDSDIKFLNTIDKKASTQEVLAGLNFTDWSVRFGRDFLIPFDPNRDYSLLTGSSYSELTKALNKNASIHKLTFKDWDVVFEKDSIEEFETASGSSKQNSREQRVHTLCLTTSKSLSLSLATGKVSTAAGSDATVIIRVDEQKPQYFQATAFNYNGVSLPISNKLLGYMSSGDNLRYRVNPSVPGHNSFEGSTSLKGFKEMTQSAIEFCNK